MAGVNMPKIDGNMTNAELINAVGKMTKELTWLLNNLDWKNINELNIQLNGGAAVTIDNAGITITDGTDVTFQADVNGNVTMTGATVQSRNGYPMVVMDPDTELFGAYYNANEGISIEANYGSAPSLNLIHNGNIVGRIDMLIGYPEIIGNGNIEIGSYGGGNIYLNPTIGYVVLSGGDFSKLKNESNVTLQSVLNTKASSGSSTGSSGAHNHGIAPGTQLMTVGGGFVTWVGASDHSHLQS